MSQSVTTWAEAKTLVLTSPVVVLLAWGGLQALRASPRRLAGLVAWAAGIAIVGGVLASDALQYHTSNLAPTARYDELASLNGRFASWSVRRARSRTASSRCTLPTAPN